MTMLYPIVLETEESGAVSAYVPGLPVYAAADSHAKAERAIRAVLTEYLNAHPASRPDARVRVARVLGSGKGASQRRWRCRSGRRQSSAAKARPHVPTAGWGGALPGPRPRERLGRRPRANASPKRCRSHPTIPRPVELPSPSVRAVN